MKKRIDLKERQARRYLRAVSAALPCTRRQKREILSNLREIIENSGADPGTLERKLGMPEDIVQTYIGDDAPALFGRAKKRRTAIILAAAALVLIQAVLVCVLFFAPSGRYTERIESLDNGTERVEVMIEGKTKSLPFRRGSKTVTYYERGTKIWSISVTGEFVYTGSSCGVIDMDYEITLYSEDAALYDESSCMSGNMAFVSATVVYRDGSLLKNCALTCGLDGTLS